MPRFPIPCVSCKFLARSCPVPWCDAYVPQLFRALGTRSRSASCLRRRRRADPGLGDLHLKEARTDGGIAAGRGIRGLPKMADGSRSLIRIVRLVLSGPATAAEGSVRGRYRAALFTRSDVLGRRVVKGATTIGVQQHVSVVCSPHHMPPARLHPTPCFGSPYRGCRRTKRTVPRPGSRTRLIPSAGWCSLSIGCDAPLDGESPKDSRRMSEDIIDPRPSLPDGLSDPSTVGLRRQAMRALSCRPCSSTSAPTSRLALDVVLSRPSARIGCAPTGAASGVSVGMG